MKRKLVSQLRIEQETNTGLIRSQSAEIRSLQNETKALTANITKVQEDSANLQGAITGLKLKVAESNKEKDFPIQKRL